MCPYLPAAHASPHSFSPPSPPSASSVQTGVTCYDMTAYTTNSVTATTKTITSGVDVSNTFCLNFPVNGTGFISGLGTVAWSGGWVRERRGG